MILLRLLDSVRIAVAGLPIAIFLLTFGGGAGSDGCAPPLATERRVAILPEAGEGSTVDPGAEPLGGDARCASCPSGCVQQEITGAALDVLAKRVREIDRAFEANDYNLLVRVLGDSDGAARRQLECQFQTAFENLTYLSRKSTILKAVRLCNTDAVYTRIESLMRPRGSKGSDWAFDRRQVSSIALFFSWASQEKERLASPVLARMERFDASAIEWLDVQKSDVMSCPPCGWSLPKPKNWFIVPRVAAEGGSFDSISFIHPALRISIDFDSYANANILCPLAMAERDHEVLERMLHAKPESVKILKKSAVNEGDVIRADLVADIAGAGKKKETLRFHRCYRSIPPFLFSFVARGEPSEMAGHRVEVNAIVDGLRFEHAYVASPDAISSVARVHMGAARSEGGEFLDEQLGLAITPPADWAATEQPGAGRFCVRYSPAGDKSVTLTILAWSGQARCYGEQEISQFFENRKAQLPPSEYINFRMLRREMTDHRNGVDVCFVVESQWQSGAAGTSGESMRERFVAIPIGRFLCGIVARAPVSRFDSVEGVFNKAIDSFRHQVAK
jgi:hypothetical protein